MTSLSESFEDPPTESAMRTATEVTTTTTPTMKTTRSAILAREHVPAFVATIAVPDSTDIPDYNKTCFKGFKNM